MAEEVGGAGRRLRAARLGQGLSQAELAARCQVSRQAVAGMEAGEWSPSLAVALRLARELGRSVEQLFGESERAQEVTVAALGPASPSGRAEVVEVFGKLVGVPRDGLMGSVPGFTVASSQLLGPTTALRPALDQEALLVAGCDPALPLLAEGLRAAGSQFHLAWWPCGSAEAERLLRAGVVHAAGVHHPIGAGWSPPTGCTRVGLARWREGILSPATPGFRVEGLAEAVDRGLRLANRESGAEARRLLDRELERLGSPRMAGYETRFPGHLPIAAAIAAGAADLGVATEPVALALGLHFSPLSEEESVLLLPEELLESRELAALLEGLAHPRMAAQLSLIPGYDPSILAAIG